MKLYEYTQEFAELADAWQNDIDNEQNVDYEKMFDALTVAFDKKAENVAIFVRSMDSDVDAIDAEIKRLQRMKKQKESSAKWLAEYLKRCMVAMNKTEIKTPLFKIKIKKNPASVNITDESKIPAKYFVTVPETKSVDKAAIRADIEAGIGIVGAELVTTNTRLEIK